MDFKAIDLLLSTFSRMLTDSQVHVAKRQLKGHVTKESLQQIKHGRDFVTLLRSSGLVGERKLAFLRKLLYDAGLTEFVNLLDEYIAINRKIQNPTGDHAESEFLVLK